jgi:DNA invertase Pin-like site-specific DNA recombinase
MAYCTETVQLGISAHMLVGYMRVSTDGDRQVLDLQRDALLAAGVDQRHLFEDHASGSRGERAGLAKALAFLRPDDCLAVWKLDRLGRSLPHLLSTVNGLKERGVAFRSLTEQMDTTTPQGEFLFHVFGALAQFERSLIQERVRAGLAAARRRGRRGGRPVAIDGEKLAAVVVALDGGATKAAVLPHFRHQAQHAHRLLGPDRLVCRPQDAGEHKRCADSN